MTTLAFESSAKAASVAIMRDGRLLAQYYQDSGLTHSRTLMKMAEDILKNNEMTVADIDRVAVARGPGSFTGIRIGVAAAKGFAWGADIPVRAVSTLYAAARVFASDGVTAPRDSVIIAPVMDARRDEFYNALFELKNGIITRLCEDRAIAGEALAGEVSAGEVYGSAPIILTGDGAEKCAGIFDALGAPYSMAPQLLRLQCALGVALAAEEVPDVSATEVSPVYLRVSQAERVLAERAEASKK